MNTRRDFLKGSACAVAGAAVSGCVTTGAEAVDPNLSVFLSDIHVVSDDPRFFAAFADTREQLQKRVDEILAMRPRPARVVSFGDLAFSNGEPSSYACAAKLLKPLSDAGIVVVHGMGNHDRRNTFAAVFPDAVRQSKVSGCVVSVVDLGTADLVLLDSLKGKDGEADGPVEGGLDEAQQQWMMKALPGWRRPLFVGAHHPAHELTVGGRRMVTFLKECPNVMGWFCGHDHVWRKECLVGWWANNEDPIRSLTLPSAGLFGDIGLVTVRTAADRLTAVLDQKAYWFNNAPRPGEHIPELWHEIVKENQGQYCVFPYERPLRRRWYDPQ